MDIEHWLHDPRPRRRFLQAAGLTVVGGSTVFLAACGTAEETAGAQAGGGVGGGDVSGNPDDEALLTAAIGLEQMAVAAYAAAAEALTEPDARELALTFRRQEQEHLDGLVAALRLVGGKAPAAKSDYGLPELRSTAAVVAFAVDMENTAIAAYIDAIPRFTDPKLRATSAAITANEAEHVALLHGLIGDQPFPAAFVTGKKTEAGTPGGSEQ